MPTALAISPHLDDAAFSCGGTLAALAADGWRVVIATVFTASVPDPQGFALACQVDKGLPPDVDYMALRRNEDADAAAALRCETPVWLPYREAPHRGYHSAKELFSEVLADDEIDAAVALGLATLIDDLAPELILAPQAIGGHVDHVQVVRALRRVALDAPVLWWRDFPYTVRSVDPPEPFRDDMTSMPEQVVALTPEAVMAKRLACRAYRTQIGFQFGGEAALDARIDAEGGVERFRLQARGLLLRDIVGAALVDGAGAPPALAS